MKKIIFILIAILFSGSLAYSQGRVSTSSSGNWRDWSGQMSGNPSISKLQVLLIGMIGMVVLIVKISNSKPQAQVTGDNGMFRLAI